MNKPPLVEITWSDIASHSGWHALEEAIDKTPMKCVSVGYIINKTRKLVSVAQTIADNGEVGEVLCLPTSIIQELREL